MSSFLHFTKDEFDGAVAVYNKKQELLGTIYVHKAWKKWVFAPVEGTFFDGQCIGEIAEELNKLQKGIP